MKEAYRRDGFFKQVLIGTLKFQMITMFLQQAFIGPKRCCCLNVFGRYGYFPLNLEKAKDA